VRVQSLDTGDETVVHARYVLDATELGDLLPMTGTEYAIGAESKRDTGEPNAVEGDTEPDNLQGITWCFALAYDSEGEHTLSRPAKYDFWRDYRPAFWPGPLLGFQVLHAHSGQSRTLPLFRNEGYDLFPYRQIVEPSLFGSGYTPHPVTIVNWPQNDYFLESPLGADGQTDIREKVYEDAKELSRCLLYWLQTEASRHDGGTGYPGLYLRPDITGTDDGFAKYPYIREGRRIRSRFTVLEQHVAAYTNEGRDRAVDFPDSVGIGAYRIDLHPSTNGANTIDTSTLPFQIPLGALIPERVQNLLPAAKNLGVTHITNGCYRLHPIEWNVGEAAGLLAGFCLARDLAPAQVLEDSALLAEYQALLIEQGIELDWPKLRAL
jgi:hypothetical protein